MSTNPIPAGEFRSRIIEPDAFVADTAAFVDVKLPRSVGKASYSFIGPGVSQNADQTINLTEPHGFNVGAASMPHGVVNNPHLHYTVELFFCTRGAWRFDVGAHGEQSLEVRAGDIFSAPTWVFRGFTNIGPDDGWLFVVLGRDETGGIIWAPHVLEEAAETGMFLRSDNTVVEVAEQSPPADTVAPLSAADLDEVDRYTDDELAARLVGRDDLVWSSRALLSSFVPGLGGEIAAVVGHGMSQDRRQRSPITDPHGFSVEWLRVAPGERTGVHRHDDSQVVFLVEGDWQVSVNTDDHAEHANPAGGSLVSIPAGAWRDFANAGVTDAYAVVVNGSDSPTQIEWHPEVKAAAASAGWGLDTSGHTAPINLLPRGHA